MFTDPGKKIKILAKVFFAVMTVASIILAFVFGTYSSYSFRSGSSTEFIHAIFWPLLLGGPLFAYISSLFIYGFGQLIENTGRSCPITEMPHYNSNASDSTKEPVKKEETPEEYAASLPQL